MSDSFPRTRPNHLVNRDHFSEKLTAISYCPRANALDGVQRRPLLASHRNNAPARLQRGSAGLFSTALLLELVP
jgi:hypothetical protein